MFAGLSLGLIMIASLFSPNRGFHPIEHLALLYFLNFRTEPSKAHPDKEGFWDSGEGLSRNNTFEVVKMNGLVAGLPCGWVRGTTAEGIGSRPSYAPRA
jgi:hypothetical protein